MKRKKENWKFITRVSFDGGETYQRLDEMSEEKKAEAMEGIYRKIDFAMAGIGYERVRRET